jgi:putative transposase
MSLRASLKHLDLAKSTYMYQPPGSEKKERPYRLDPDLQHALSQLSGYELTLGYRKLADYLRSEHDRIWNRKKVYKHMKTLGLLQPRHIKRCWKKNRRLSFSSPIASNVRWEMDLTWVHTQMGNVYLFMVEDTHDRELIGGEMGLQCKAEQAIQALRQALIRRFGCEQAQGLSLTIRVDRGCQFTAEAFGSYAQSCGIEVEYCGIQTPNDKPYIESFIGCYKQEEVYRNDYASFFEAYEAWQRYVAWYNEKRPHGSIGNRSPRQFREAKNLSLILT